MDPLMQMSPFTLVLSNLSTYLPALGVRTAALLLVVLMTRPVLTHPARKLAIVALSLLLADKVLSALSASVYVWLLVIDNRLLNDLTVAMASNLLGSLLPKLMESGGLLMLAWAMVKALQHQAPQKTDP